MKLAGTIVRMAKPRNWSIEEIRFVGINSPKIAIIIINIKPFQRREIYHAEFATFCFDVPSSLRYTMDVRKIAMPFELLNLEESYISRRLSND
jgi:hypothetical protein